jgi:membrane protein
VLGVVIVLSGVVGIGLGAAVGSVASWLGLRQNPGVEAAMTLSTGFALIIIDAGVLGILIRLLARIRLSATDVIPGLLLGALALQVLKLSGGLLLHQVNGNPLLAGAVIVALLLLWLHMAARVLLLSASFGVCLAERRGRWPTPGPATDSIEAFEA